jgi:hypothetical protein
VENQKTRNGSKQDPSNFENETTLESLMSFCLEAALVVAGEPSTLT